jgi:cytochrome c-type biogenesis protein CcmH/NrfF
MPKKMGARKIRKLTDKIVIHIVKKLLGMALLATALLLPLVNIFTAAQVEASEQAEQVTLMQLEEVSDLIMSPGCDYKYTLSYCPSAEADQMRELVKDKISAGESTEQILDYFASVYGPKVMAQPAKKGFYFFAWWFPYFLLFDIFLLVGLILFVWRKKSASEDNIAIADDDESETSRKDMEDLLEKEVREFRKE